MPANDRKLASLLFEYKTTNLKDYNSGEILPITRTEFIEKNDCFRISPPPLKYIHTFNDWREGSRVSIELFVKPKDVVRTNPRDVQQRYDPPEDVERDEVLKTRPRLVMTPSVCVDNIPLRSREIFIEDFYSTTKNKTIDAPLPSNIRAPFPGPPASANPITLPYVKALYVSPEWRMESASWDARQLRAFAEPTKEFWLARTPMCKVCDETSVRIAIKKTRKHGN